MRPGEPASDHPVPLVLGGEPLPVRPAVLCAGCKVAWQAEWDAGMLDAGQPMRSVAQSAASAEGFTNVTLKFGDTVPAAWRKWIRANLPRYVPPKFRKGTGPSTLYKRER